MKLQLGIERWGGGILLLLLSACENPGGISDSEYLKYKELGAPKILYSCKTRLLRPKNPDAIKDCMKKESDPVKGIDCFQKALADMKPVVEVGYAAGVGMAVTYNKLLGDVKAGCDGEVTILDSKF